MTWEYLLTGLTVGIIIGVIVMRFGNYSLRKQKNLQYKLEKSRTELDNYRMELKSYFGRSANILEKMANECRHLHKNIGESSNTLLSDYHREDNIFNECTDQNDSNNSILSERQPRDYQD